MRYETVTIYWWFHIGLVGNLYEIDVLVQEWKTRPVSYTKEFRQRWKLYCRKIDYMYSNRWYQELNPSWPFAVSSHLRSDSFFLFDSCFGNTKVLGSSHLFIVISNPKFGFRARKSEEEWKTEKNVNRFPFTSRRMKSNIYWSGYMVGVIGVASRRRIPKVLPPF